MKTIGVLGGMGPESTALFYMQLIRQCQKQYGAKYDEDFPEIFIYNLPIPDIVEGIKKPEATLSRLVYGAKKLEMWGADFIVMPCNTAHYFYEDVKKQLRIDFLSIAKETANKAKERGYTRVGLLATETTVNEGVYARDFDYENLTLLLPGNQERLTKIILNILAGKKTSKDKRTLSDIIAELEAKGAEAVILGCTDLSIMFDSYELSMLKQLDSTDTLAEAAIKYARKI
jgi:aspartate racemase